MEIIGLSGVTPGTKADWFELLKIGQRLRVQVLSVDPSGKAQILLDGKEITAYLETEAQSGDRFYARVQSNEQGNLVLVKEALTQQEQNGSGKGMLLDLPAKNLLAERGLAANPDFLPLVKEFAGSKGNLPDLFSIYNFNQGKTSDPKNQPGNPVSTGFPQQVEGPLLKGNAGGDSTYVNPNVLTSSNAVSVDEHNGRPVSAGATAGVFPEVEEQALTPEKSVGDKTQETKGSVENKTANELIGPRGEGAFKGEGSVKGGSGESAELNMGKDSKVPGSDGFKELQTREEQAGRVGFQESQSQSQTVISGKGNIIEEQTSILEEGNSLKAKDVAGEGRNLKGISLETANSLINATVSNEGQPLDETTVMQRLWEMIPQWSTLRDNQTKDGGAEILLKLLKALGLDFESRLANLKLAEKQGDSELNQLKDTVKAQLMELIHSSSGAAGKEGKGGEKLEPLLNYLTGQQLWLQSGSREPAYILLHLPVRHQDSVYEARIAVESGRKGAKIDIDHCRIALMLDTPNLGEIGVDAWFFEKTLSIKILSSYPTNISEWLTEMKEEIGGRFNQIGFRLGEIKVEDLTEKVPLEEFITGKRRSGVDYKT